jgi:putative membrane protein
LNRRSMLLSLSAGTPMLAGALLQPAAAQSAPGTASEGLEKYRRMTLQYGALSLETSRLALQRAQHPMVRQFASFEQDEQLTIAQVLTNERQPSPPKLQPQNAQILQTLAGMSAGPGFDDQYVADQLQVHAALLAIQQDFLKGQRVITADPVHVAMLARTVIQMHIALLHDLQNHEQHA